MSEKHLPLFQYGRDRARFDGSDITADDNIRLTGQIESVYDTMMKGKWLTLDEISIWSGAPPASASAQLRNLRKPRFGSHIINKRRRTKGLWEYKMTI